MALGQLVHGGWQSPSPITQDQCPTVNLSLNLGLINPTAITHACVAKFSYPCHSARCRRHVRGPPSGAERILNLGLESSAASWAVSSAARHFWVAVDVGLGVKVLFWRPVVLGVRLGVNVLLW